jgi:hypothetical protein
MTKERVVERVRTELALDLLRFERWHKGVLSIKRAVVNGKGASPPPGGGTPFPSTATVLCEIKKVTASERSASQIYR